MTFQIPLSHVENRELFEKTVADHVEKLNAFTKEVGKPRPVAHPMIEAAITRLQLEGQPDEHVPDYEFIDDTPPPPPPLTLEEKKEQVALKLREFEEAAKERLLPRRQMRLKQVLYQMACTTPEDKRNPEQIEAIVAQQSFTKAWLAIELIAARAEAAIDSLTEDTIDSWQPPTFE